MPTTRPGSKFLGGVCQACRNFDAKSSVDWRERQYELNTLCNIYRQQTPYNCILPVSGGKDSYRLVHEMVTVHRMRPLLVTVTDSFTHTKAGTANLRNLIETFNLNHWTYTISHDLFRRTTKWAFEQTGEALKFVEYAIYTIPIRLAQQMGIGLVVYGENSAYEYGNEIEDDPLAGNRHVAAMAAKVRGEKEWWQKGGVWPEEVENILPIDGPTFGMIYLSRYIPWSSLDNRDVACKLGFKDLDDTCEWHRKGTIEQFEQIDSYAYMVHLWLKYPKFGFQRVTDIASRRVREGKLTLDKAKDLIARHDPVLDPRARRDFCSFMGYTKKDFWKIVACHNRGYL
jgi:N-acetyl sugar amidotransferase